MSEIRDAVAAIDKARNAAFHKRVFGEEPKTMLKLTTQEWDWVREAYPPLPETPPSHIWGVKLHIIPSGEAANNGS